jgi:SAM-dependent methyltransferase
MWLMTNRVDTARLTLQDRAERLRELKFLGVPIDGFEQGGREQLIYLLMNGLTPTSKVLDIGCGVLRGGYWLIHFLDPGCYFGIEPSPERLQIGIEGILEPQADADKHPRFDSNSQFDTAVFGETFDYFLAYSIWTHASKSQILVMLDGFLRNSSPDAVFLTTFLPTTWRHRDYRGESWVGTSHESDVPGCIRHSLRWIKRECRRRELSVSLLGDDETLGQSWLRISRHDRSQRIRAITFRPRWRRRLERIMRRLRHFVRLKRRE